MARRTKVYKQLNWVGGINTAANSGFIPDTDLVTANHILFSTSGSRKKREGFTYLDSNIPDPDFRSSSGTTRTLKWTTNSLQVASPQDDKLVNGEKITVSTSSTGNEASYAATAVAIASLTNVAEVTTVQCVADVSDSLQNKYFLLYSAENLTVHGIWYGNGGGGDAQPTNTAVDTWSKVTYTTNDVANTIASLTQAVVDGLSDFGATVSTDTVTVTNAATGIATDASDAGSTGFTLTVTTQGGHTITYTASGSLSESSTAVSDLTIARAYKIISLIDYWRLDGSSVKQQLHIAASDEVKFYRFTAAGIRQEISGTGGPSGSPTRIVAKVLNDKCILSFDSLNDKAIKYDPDSSASYAALGGTPPDFFVMETYLGRLWTNDKANPDRLHYSSTGNPEEWNGAGDSGAIDIAVGDGDSIGITGIFVFKNLLYVAKRDSLYRITGNTPETFKVEDVSKGIGIESHLGIAYIDQDDVVFPSRRGFHAASSTDKFGDVEAQFLSYKIQPSFNDLTAGRIKFIQGEYVSELNSLAFSVSDNASRQNCLYLYNVIFQSWYKWPNVSCEALAVRRNGDSKQLIIGTNTGRIITTQNGKFTDYGTTPIVYKIKSGTIYPGQDPHSWKGFKRLSLFFSPKGRSNFTITVKIDNQANQSFLVEPGQGGDLLGNNFVLGASVLGTSEVLAPYSVDLSGHGRGMTLEVVQSGTDESIDFYGFAVEYEEEGVVPEVIT